MYKQEFKSERERTILDKEMQKVKVYCKCGHSIPMPNADRTICSYCQRWVYRNKEVENEYKKKEFEIKMRRMMKNDL